MSKGAYIGINDVARKMTGGYIGVNDVARKVKKAYVGDANGIARLWWEPEPAYLTFSSPSTFSISVAAPAWDGTMEYSLDAKTWYTWSGSAVSGTKVYVRGAGNTKTTYAGSSATYWTITGSNVSCIGNIETLLDYTTVAAGGHPTMAEYCYTSIFMGCSALVTPPDLRATTLTNYCYQGMFAHCPNLTTAPKLPATTVGDGSYSSMFLNCTSLTTVPALPATKLPSSGYAGMFYGCTSIKLSTIQTNEYTKEYRIPTSGTGENMSVYSSTANMFTNTGGTFTGTPTINTAYYLHKDCTIV